MGGLAAKEAIIHSIINISFLFSGVTSPGTRTCWCCQLRVITTFTMRARVPDLSKSAKWKWEVRKQW